MRNWKRVIAVLLSAATLLSIFPASVFAEEIGTALAEPPAEIAEIEESASEDANENQEEQDKRETVSKDAESPRLVKSERDAELDSAADTVYEIGYRFDTASPWTVVGVDEEYDAESYRIFDKNRNYAIIPDSAAQFPISVYFMIWDAQGRSEEYKNSSDSHFKNGDHFEFADETDKISINAETLSLARYSSSALSAV